MPQSKGDEVAGHVNNNRGRGKKINKKRTPTLWHQFGGNILKTLMTNKPYNLC